MKRMHNVHLAGLDLNLLVALDALLTERNVTRAARRVGLTQPAMSHALGRLRELLDDPLFVRTPTGMDPTARAIAMGPPLTRALSDIERAIAEPPRFDPATATRTFTVAMSDYMEFALLPAFLGRLSRVAPGVDLVVRGEPSFEELAKGALDLALLPLHDTPKPGFHAAPIFEERFVCVMRKGHPLARGKLTLDRFCAADHVLIAPHGTRRGIVDDVLARTKRSRRVALVLQHFLAAPHVIAETDLIITLGERVARVFQRMLPLVTVEPPVKLPAIAVSQLWHERQAHDPALTWLRNELRETTALGARPKS